MDINIRSFGGEVAVLLLQLQPEPANIAAGSAQLRRAAVSPRWTPTPADPNLKGQYIDEWLDRLRIRDRPQPRRRREDGHRKLGRVIEDFLIPSEGDVLHRQPGQRHRHRDGLLRRRAHRAGAEGEADEQAFEVNARKPSQQQLAVPGQRVYSASWKATTTARSRRRRASSIRTSTRRSTMPTSW